MHFWGRSTMHNAAMPDIAAIERATLDAVAPLRIAEDVPGWLLPFDTAPIGRARSAVPLQHDGLPVSSLDLIAERYASEQLPVVWRMADAAGLMPLCAALEKRGFAPQQATRVQTASIDTLLSHTNKHDVQVRTEPDAAWRSVYTAPGFDPVDGAARIAALSRSHAVLYATVILDGLPCAAGTASVSRGWLGVHGMRTAQAYRQRGLATAILAALAQAGAARGIHRSFLQVEADNAEALSLYARHGFQTAWTYQYWRRSERM